MDAHRERIHVLFGKDEDITIGIIIAFVLLFVNCRFFSVLIQKKHYFCIEIKVIDKSISAVLCN